VYGDAYGYYVPAGIAYVNGALPDSINPEHPPLAKYVIGIFAVYLHDASAASLIFGLLTAIVVFLLVKKFTATLWAPMVAVWLLSFDPVNIGLSVYPMLDIFMIFFATFSVYLLTLVKKPVQYVFVGVTVGLALACKWTGIFFAIPEILYVIGFRRFLNGLELVGGGIVGYVFPYVPLILDKGILNFLRLQVWMGGFMMSAHGAGGYNPLVTGLVDFIIFHLTTFAPVTGYDPRFHPEAFRFLGFYYISLADMINPFITLAVFPVLYGQTRRFFKCGEGDRLLLLLVFAGTMIGEVLFPVSLVTWYDAPLVVITCGLLADLLIERDDEHVGRKSIVYLYLTLVATWLLFATAIVFIRIAHYRALSNASVGVAQPKRTPEYA
jgi:hypothetical protein